MLSSNHSGSGSSATIANHLRAVFSSLKEAWQKGFPPPGPTALTMINLSGLIPLMGGQMEVASSPSTRSRGKESYARSTSTVTICLYYLTLQRFCTGRPAYSEPPFLNLEPLYQIGYELCTGCATSCTWTPRFDK